MKYSVIASALLLLAGTSAFAANRSSQILTAAVAESVIGAPAKPAMINTFDDTEMGKIWVSNANYSCKANGSKTASLLIRHAQSKEEAVSTFNESKQKFAGSDIAGLGEGAFRNNLGQLNVLKGQNWLIITAGETGKPDQASEEKLAKDILPKITF